MKKIGWLLALLVFLLGSCQKCEELCPQDEENVSEKAIKDDQSLSDPDFRDLIEGDDSDDGVSDDDDDDGEITDDDDDDDDDGITDDDDDEDDDDDSNRTSN